MKLRKYSLGAPLPRSATELTCPLDGSIFVLCILFVRLVILLHRRLHGFRLHFHLLKKPSWIYGSMVSHNPTFFTFLWWKFTVCEAANTCWLWFVIIFLLLLMPSQILPGRKNYWGNYFLLDEQNKWWKMALQATECKEKYLVSL